MPCIQPFTQTYQHIRINTRIHVSIVTIGWTYWFVQTCKLFVAWCFHVCVCASMCVSATNVSFACLYACVHLCLCVFVCMILCLHIKRCKHWYVLLSIGMDVNVFVCMGMCWYVCVNGCMHGIALCTCYWIRNLNQLYMCVCCLIRFHLCMHVFCTTPFHVCICIYNCMFVWW